MYLWVVQVTFCGNFFEAFSLEFIDKDHLFCYEIIINGKFKINDFMLIHLFLNLDMWIGHKFNTHNTIVKIHHENIYYSK